MNRGPAMWGLKRAGSLSMLKLEEALVRWWISPRSNSAMPANTVNAKDETSEPPMSLGINRSDA